MNLSTWQQRQQAAADVVREARNARSRELHRLTKEGKYKPKRRHAMYMGVHDEASCRHPACLAQRYARIAAENRIDAQYLGERAAEARERAHDDVEIPF